MQHQHFKGYPRETPLPDPVKEIERRRGIMTEATFRSNMEIAGYPIHPLTWETIRTAYADSSYDSFTSQRRSQGDHKEAVRSQRGRGADNRNQNRRDRSQCTEMREHTKKP